VYNAIQAQNFNADIKCLFMKDVIKDILHNDIITKTKSTFQDLVSGVKNLFRHTHTTENDAPEQGNLNNHLKSPDEIEAELRVLSVSQSDETGSVKNDDAKNEVEVIENSESHFKMNVINETLPEYMEENY